VILRQEAGPEHDFRDDPAGKGAGAGDPWPRGQTSRALRGAIAAIEGERLTLGQLVDALGRSGQGLVLLLLALPAFIPVPALPTGFVFGTALSIVALQMAAGRQSLALPDFLRRRSLPRKAVESTVERLDGFMSRLDGVLRPRLLALTDRMATVIVAILIFILGVTLVLPIPFGNQGPAFAIVVFAFGLLERDGLAIIAGVFFAIIGVAWNVGLILFGAAITERMMHLLPW
jgi:hypothetical protein